MPAQGDVIFFYVMENNKYLGILVAIIAIGIITYVISANKSQAPTVTTDVNNSSEQASNTLPVAGSGKTTASKTSSVTQSSVPLIKDGIYIISYKNSGFSPQSLEVKRGTAVRFINDSTKAMRIGSIGMTNSPSYQDLSQPKTVGKGSYYEYTFNDAGTFGYMNTNNSADTGSIVIK